MVLIEARRRIAISLSISVLCSSWLGPNKVLPKLRDSDRIVLMPVVGWVNSTTGADGDRFLLMPVVGLDGTTVAKPLASP